MTPRTQSALIGHEALEKTLLHSWTQSRLHHALAFVGPKGIGKATCAFRFATFLLSKPSRETSPRSLAIDVNSPVRARVASGGHGDLLVVEPKGDAMGRDLTVDQIRPIGKFLSQTTLEGGWRIVIVDGDMNRNAANALLKSLEEPPANTLIILISETLSYLSPTIRSRCIPCSFSSLSPEQTQRVAETLYPDLEANQRQGLIALSNGRPGYIQDLININAIALYQNFLATILSLENKGLEHAIAFCQTHAAKPKKKDAIDPFSYLEGIATTIMHRLMLAAENNVSPEVYPQEKAHLAKLLDWRSLPRWSLIFGKVSILLQSGQFMHLDRFQTLVNVMNTIDQGVSWNQYATQQ